MRIRNAVLAIVSTTALITGLAACGAQPAATTANLTESANTALHDVQNGNWADAATYLTGPGAATAIAELAVFGPIAQAAAKTQSDITAAVVHVSGTTGTIANGTDVENWTFTGGKWREIITADVAASLS